MNNITKWYVLFIQKSVIGRKVAVLYKPGKIIPVPYKKSRRYCSRLKRSPHMRNIGCSNTGRDGPKS